MKTLYLECNMGASGDMIMAALLDLYEKPQEFIDFMNGLGIPGAQLTLEMVKKNGVWGSSVHVLIHGAEEQCVGADTSVQPENSHNGHPHHGPHLSRSREDIHTLISSLALSEKVKGDAVKVYDLIAQAEAEVHGEPVNEIHFHEVGALDAIVDVVGCCQLMSQLAPDVVLASSVCVGSGEIHCAHGVLPVPAPATALLLCGVPIYAGEIHGELCTPTGAALLKYFVSSFESMPALSVDKIGYGMGQKDFSTVNCLRAFIGESGAQKEDVVEISCNLDDMTGESIAFVVGRLMEAGALDVFVAPITMKKGRPAQMLTCLCRPSQEEFLARIVLAETTTLGIRFKTCRRMVLSSRSFDVDTPYGIIRWKVSCGYGIEKGKPEYEDVRKAADKHHVPFDRVKRAAEFAAQSRLSDLSQQQPQIEGRGCLRKHD